MNIKDEDLATGLFIGLLVVTVFGEALSGRRNGTPLGTVKHVSALTKEGMKEIKTIQDVDR